MFTNLFRVVNALVLFHKAGGQFMTVGELAKWTNMPKSTVRRSLEKAQALDMVLSEKLRYKKTGKWVFVATAEAVAFVSKQKDMF